MDNEYVIVWTDGACSNNQDRNSASAGVGVYFGPGSRLNISEHLPGKLQTNQRAELTAVIRAMEIVRDRNLLIVSDSNYAIKGATEWLKNWKKNGWVNAKKEPVANKDLWIKMDELLREKRDIKFKWVKGHSTEPGNIEADKLAVAGINKK